MNIPFDVIRLIASYLVEPKIKLLDWISLDKNNWNILSAISNAIHLLEQNTNKINWTNLLFNFNAIYMLEKNLNKIVWNNLLQNPNIFEIDKKQLKINIDEQQRLFIK